MTQEPSTLESLGESIQAFVNEIDEEAPVLIRGAVIAWESMIFNSDGQAMYRVNYAALPDTAMSSVIGILELSSEIARNDMLGGCDHDD